MKQKKDEFAEFAEFLKACIKCDKKCANCPDNKEKLRELRDDFYPFKEEQIELNTQCKAKMEIVNTMPAVKRDLYITMGTSVCIIILLGLIFRVGLGISKEVSDLKINNKEFSLHLEEVKADKDNKEKQTKNFTIMQQDIKHLKEDFSGFGTKLDEILDKMPKG